MNEVEKMILAELQVQYKEGLKSWDSLDNKLIVLLIVGGILLLIVNPCLWYQFLPYSLMVVLILIGLLPRATQSPIRLDWGEIWQEYLYESDENAYNQLVSNYLYAYSANHRHGKFKAWLLVVSMVLLVMQVSVALIALI